MMSTDAEIADSAAAATSMRSGVSARSGPDVPAIASCSTQAALCAMPELIRYQPGESGSKELMSGPMSSLTGTFTAGLRSSTPAIFLPLRSRARSIPARSMSLQNLVVFRGAVVDEPLHGTRAQVAGGDLPGAGEPVLGVGEEHGRAARDALFVADRRVEEPCVPDRRLAHAARQGGVRIQRHRSVAAQQQAHRDQVVVGVDEHQSCLVLTRRQQVLLCLAESPVGALRAGDVDLMLAAGRWRAAGILVQGGLQSTGLQFQGPPGLADQVRKLDFSTRRTNSHGSIVATKVFRRK